MRRQRAAIPRASVVFFAIPGCFALSSRLEMCLPLRCFAQAATIRGPHPPLPRSRPFGGVSSVFPPPPPPWTRFIIAWHRSSRDPRRRSARCRPPAFSSAPSSQRPSSLPPLVRVAPRATRSRVPPLACTPPRPPSPPLSRRSCDSLAVVLALLLAERDADAEPDELPVRVVEHVCELDAVDVPVEDADAVDDAVAVAVGHRLRLL